MRLIIIIRKQGNKMRNLKRKIIPLSLCVSMILGSQLFAENTSTLLEEVQIAGQGNSLYKVV